MSEKITEEELKAIKDAAVLKAEKVAVAEKAVLEARAAELAHQVTVQHIFIKYGLTFTDVINDNTGVITRDGGTVGKDGFVKTGDASDGESVEEV